MEPGPLLDELLTWWRETRAPELVPAIEKASALASQSRQPVAAKKTMQAGWLARAEARDAADLPHLLAVLADARAAEVTARLDALAAWPDDPRVVTALCDYLHQPRIVGPSGRGVVMRMTERLLAIEDPRRFARLDAIVSGRVQFAGARLQGVGRAAWQAVVAAHQKLLAQDEPPPLDAPARTRLAGIVDALDAALTPRADGAPLLAAVLDALDDDRPRLVYADWLLERGDPRGEFLVLQIERARTKGAVSKRERELLNIRARAWLGPLAAVILKKGLVYERGFLHACAFQYELVEQQKLIGHALWATLAEVDVSRGRIGTLRFFNHDVCRALHTITGLAGSMLKELRRPLRRLGLRHFTPTLLPQLEGQAATLVELDVDQGAPAEIVGVVERTLPKLARLTIAEATFARVDGRLAPIAQQS